MASCLFTNDNNVSVLLLDHPISETFKTRDKHECLFRKINAFLISEKVIKHNIIDLGAWIGDNAIVWSKLIDGIVYAIDPSDVNCDYMKKMAELNRIANMKVIQTAISDKNELLSTNDDLIHATFSTETGGRNVVSSMSLDHLVEQKDIENVGYIHLDVEGMEYKVLQGSVALIEKYRPIISFEQHIEIEDYSIMLNFFNKRNYKVFLIDEVLLGCRADCRNSLAFPIETYNEDIINAINKLIGREIMILK